jgi:peptide/nickel transport system substrate-binding protein
MSKRAYEKSVFSLTACSLICLLFTLFIAAAFAAQPPHGGTLMMAVEGEEANLNPQVVTGATAQPIVNNIFNLLIYMDFKFEIIPGLARSWEVSKDGLTYTFGLVKNAAWHDGKPFTSADVLYTLQEIYPQNPRGSWWKPGVNVSPEAPDPYTFVIKLKEPFAPLLPTLAFQVTGPNILPKHLYEGTDLKKNPYNNNPIGTGPFMFKEWVKGSHIELVRNPNYFAKGKENKPYIDRIVFQTIPDSSARTLALKKGEIDYIPSTFVPLEDIADLRKDKNIVIDKRGGGPETIKFFLFNLRNPPLSNKLVRQAIAYAMDRNAIYNLALAGEAKIAKSILTSNTTWAFDPKVPDYAYDPKKANALLDKAGYPRGPDGTRFKMRLGTIAGRGSDPVVVEVVRDSLKKVGIDAQMFAAELSSFYDAVFMRWDFDMVLQQAATGPDPTAGVTRFLHSRQIKKATFVNAMGYSNPEVDRLLDMEYKQIDKKQRAATWHRIQQIVLDDLPLIPVYESAIANVYRSNWADIVTTLYGSAQSREDAYMKK